MKTLVTAILMSFAGGAAMAHGGHPELPGTGGHDLAHVLIAMAVGTLALTLWLGLRGIRSRAGA